MILRIFFVAALATLAYSRYAAGQRRGYEPSEPVARWEGEGGAVPVSDPATAAGAVTSGAPGRSDDPLATAPPDPLYAQPLDPAAPGSGNVPGTGRR